MPKHPHHAPHHDLHGGPHRGHHHMRRGGPPHHHHRHRHHDLAPEPSGLHKVADWIQATIERGAPPDAVDDILVSMSQQLPTCVLPDLEPSAGIAYVQALAQRAAEANDAALAMLSQADGNALLADVVPPHVIRGLMETGISVTQVHNPTHHGHTPPHFMDIAARYPGQFKGVMNPAKVGNEVLVILVHAYTPDGKAFYVGELASMALRMWADAQLVALLADHCAPHHDTTLHRGVDQFLFWE